MKHHALRDRGPRWRGVVLLLAACGSMAAPDLAGAATSAAAVERPNLVLVLMDDHRFDAMSCAGHPFLQTPNMDRLAREGALAGNAFVTTSLCMPSRVSILTGQYVGRHGIVRNVDRRDLPEQAVTFPRVLQQAGYQTAHFGKWHLGETDEKRPGYDYWVSYLQQGRYLNPRIHVDGTTLDAQGYVDDIMTDHAIGWVREQRDRNRPFCLTLAFKAVHSGFVPPPPCENLYADATIVPPISYRDPLDDKPAFLRSVIDQENHRFVPQRQYEDFVRQYNRTVRGADDNLGRLLDGLEAAGVLDRTVVVFTSDGGYYQGEHGGLYDKRSAYEPSIRVPMLVRYPPLIRANTRLQHMILNIDIAPTLLDLAGVAVPPSMQGRSAKQLLAGEPASGWRSSFLVEYYREWRGFTSTPTLEGVRTERYKYVRYLDPVDRPELYDLIDDPHERINRHDDPACSRTLSELRFELDRLRAEIGTPATATAPARR